MEEDKSLDLNKFGFAPGMYTITCVSCGEKPWFCDKLAIRCEPCAKKLLAIASASASKTNSNTTYCGYALYNMLQQSVPEQTKLNAITSNIDDILKSTGDLEPLLREFIRQAKISALEEAQTAMKPMLRDMLSRGQAYSLIQEVIDSI